MKPQQKEAIRQLRAEGQSYTKISLGLGISENTVKSFCRRNNLGGVAVARSESAKDIHCRECGVRVNQTIGKKQKLYCSDRCRMAWWNAHPESMNRKNTRQFTCSLCGCKFESFGKRQRKYCSRSCYGKSKAAQL